MEPTELSSIMEPVYPTEVEEDTSSSRRLVVRDGDGFERLVFGEVLVPEVPNVCGDFHTVDSVREFAYKFMTRGFGVNVEHDNPDVSGQQLHVVESFIAREGDPDFTVGSWVVGVHVLDDELWGKILDKEINGFSYEAFVAMLPVEVIVDEAMTSSGTTEPDPFDGHTHTFFVQLDDNGRPITGATSVSNGHSHNITTHTVTDEMFSHSHIYNIA